MRVKEERQTTKRTRSLSAPLMLIRPRQENKGGRRKNERNTYQHKDLSRIGLISSSSATPNQFQSAPRCFLYIYIFHFPTIQIICVGLWRASHQLHWHKHWSGHVLHSPFNGSLSRKFIQRIMISSSHWINILQQEPIRKQENKEDQ